MQVYHLHVYHRRRAEKLVSHFGFWAPEDRGKNRDPKHRAVRIIDRNRDSSPAERANRSVGRSVAGGPGGQQARRALEGRDGLPRYRCLGNHLTASYRFMQLHVYVFNLFFGILRQMSQTQKNHLKIPNMYIR